MFNAEDMIKNVGLIGITNLLIALSGIIILPFLTKTMSIEDYGLYVQFTTTISLVSLVANMSLPFTMVRFIAAKTQLEDIQEIFYSVFFVVILSTGFISSIMFLLSESIAKVLFSNEVYIVEILAVIAFFEGIIFLNLNLFRGLQNFRLYAILQVFKIFLQVILIIIFLSLNTKIISAILGILLTNIILIFITMRLVFKNIGYSFPNFCYIKEYFHFSLPTIPSNISNWVVNSSDKYLISIMLGISYVAYYNPGYAIGKMIEMVIAPLVFVLPVLLSTYYDNNCLNQVRNLLSHSMNYYLILAIPMAIGIGILSKPLLLIFTTQEIAEQGYLVIPFFAACGLMFGMYSIFAQIITLTKKTKIVGIAWTISCLLNVVLNVILIPKLYIIGASLASFFAYLFALLFVTYYSRRDLHFDINCYAVIKTTLASIIMGALLYSMGIFMPFTMANFIISIFFSIIIYLILIILFKVIPKEEIFFCVNFMKKFFFNVLDTIRLQFGR